MVLVKTALQNIRLSITKKSIMSASNPTTIVVEGNIGSGKTTFLKHFKKFSEVTVLDEPIAQWRNLQGHNLLDLMYKDPHKWTFCFQSYVQLTMLNLHTTPVVKPIKMMERSIFSARYCFVNNLKENGLMQDAEFAVLDEWFQYLHEKVPMKVDLIVYLRTNPEVAYERICRRGRSEENAITLDYLKSIHNLHEDWLYGKKYFLPAPVVSIDANRSLAELTNDYNHCEERIFSRASMADCKV